MQKKCAGGWCLAGSDANQMTWNAEDVCGSCDANQHLRIPHAWTLLLPLTSLLLSAAMGVLLAEDECVGG